MEKLIETRKIMFDVMKALELELGQKEGLSVFEWYCSTYGVSVDDIAPDTVRREVFGM